MVCSGSFEKFKVQGSKFKVEAGHEPRPMRKSSPFFNFISEEAGAEARPTCRFMIQG
jgi:hypothetical protein